MLYIWVIAEAGRVDYSSGRREVPAEFVGEVRDDGIGIAYEANLRKSALIPPPKRTGSDIRLV